MNSRTEGSRDEGFHFIHCESAGGQAGGSCGHRDNGQQSYVIELKVAKEDIGKIIGKGGRTAQALRTILGAASAKIGKRSVLEIIE